MKPQCLIYSKQTGPFLDTYLQSYQTNIFGSKGKANMFSYRVQLVPCDESTEQKLFCFNYDFKVIKYVFIIKLSESTCLRPLSYKSTSETTQKEPGCSYFLQASWDRLPKEKLKNSFPAIAFDLKASLFYWQCSGVGG